MSSFLGSFHIDKPFDLKKEEKELLKNVFMNIYTHEEFLRKYFLKKYSEIEIFLLLNELSLNRNYKFDTIIIDEAQDFSKASIEFIRLHTKRIILTGDLLQNIDQNNFDSWEDIINYKELFTYEENDTIKSNIFDLKHNFRQTYQLANASYNLRQLIKQKPITDIRSEYYPSQIEFNGVPYKLPIIKKLSDEREFSNYIAERLNHISLTFSAKIPIAIIYKTDDERSKLQNLLSEYSTSVHEIDIKNVDILFVHLLEAKGKEFPIVMCNIDDLNDNELYLVMSRAQFELDLFSLEPNIDNKYLQQLSENKWIDIEDIDFIADKKEKAAPITTKVSPILDNVNTESNQLEDKDNSKQKNAVYDEKKPFYSDLEITNVIENIEKNNEGVQTKLKKTKEHPVTTRENIPKYEADVTQYNEELDPDIITDDERYKKDFEAKILEDLKEYSNDEQVEIIQKIRFVNKSTIKNKGDKTEIKSFLQNAYKGYCQICGFTFRKTADQKNSFEVFNWNDKRVVKNKKSFVTTADSLCLCRNCSANIKWGAFEPSFVNTINRMENFETKDIDQIKEELNKIIDKNTVEIFKVHLDFDDMYALEILINKTPKSIYFTNAHLIQFIAYLQLENKMINTEETMTKKKF